MVKLAAKHYYRPSIPSLVTKEKLEIFPKLELFKIDDVFGSWENAQKHILMMAEHLI